MDINGFGWVNNHFGHDEGDQVIKHFGATIVRCVQGAGLKQVSVVRWAGDEFVLLVEDMDEKAMQALLVDTLHETLVCSPYKLHRKGEHNDTEYLLSVACGAVNLRQFEGDKKTEVIKKADTAMYFSKDLAKKILAGVGKSVPDKDFPPRGLIVTVYSDQEEKAGIDKYRELTKPPLGPPDPKDEPKAKEILREYVAKHSDDLFRHFRVGSDPKKKGQKKYLK